MRRQRRRLRRIGRRIFHQFQFELAAGLNHRYCAGRVAFAGQLHQNFVVVAAAPRLNRRFRQTESVDAALDRLERLRHRLFLDGSVRRGAKRQCVAGRLTRSSRQVPHILQLRVDQVTERSQLVRSNIAHQNVRVVDAPNLIVANALLAHLARESVQRLIRLLRDGFLHLHLQNQVRAALQVESQLDLVSEIIFQLCQRRWECRQTEKAVHAAQDDHHDEERSPLQVGIHGQKVLTPSVPEPSLYAHVARSWERLFRIFRCLHLRNCRTRDANLHLVGDLQDDRLAVQSVDRAVDSAVGDHFVPGLQRAQHLLQLLALSLLRQNEHHVEDAHHHHHHHQGAAERGAQAAWRLKYHSYEHKFYRQPVLSLRELLTCLSRSPFISKIEAASRGRIPRFPQA